MVRLAAFSLPTLILFLSGEIGGKAQIYSHSYRKSQCIDAHSCIFTAYQFEDSDQRSTLLVAAIRQKNRTWKLHIIELGPIPSGNISHKPIHHMLNAHNTIRSSSEAFVGPKVAGQQTEDIPTHIVADSEVGLVYLLSKYGSFYICDLETGAPLYFENITGATDGAPIFTLTAHPATESLVAVSRSGQVLSIAVSLPALLRTSTETAKVGQKVLDRIRARLRRMKRLDEPEDDEASSCQLSEEGLDCTSTGTSEASREHHQHLVNGHNNSINNNGYNSIDSAHSSTASSSASTTSSSFCHRPPIRPKPRTKPKPKSPRRYHFGETGTTTAVASVTVTVDAASTNGDNSYGDKNKVDELRKSSGNSSNRPYFAFGQQQPQEPLPEPPFDADEPDNEQITRL